MTFSLQLTLVNCTWSGPRSKKIHVYLYWTQTIEPCFRISSGLIKRTIAIDLDLELLKYKSSDGWFLKIKKKIICRRHQIMIHDLDLVWKKTLVFQCWPVRLFTILYSYDWWWCNDDGLASIQRLIFGSSITIRTVRCSVFGKNEKRGIHRGDKMGSFISCCVPVLCCFCSILYLLTNKDPWHLTKVVVRCVF